MTPQVWFVMEHHDYEGSDVVSVHASKASAEKEVLRLREDMDAARAAQSEYWEPDEPQGPEPVWPDGVPDCDAITVSGPWTVEP